MMLYNVDLSKNAVRSLHGTHSYYQLNYDVKLLENYFVFKGVRKITVMIEKSYESYCVLWAAYMAGVTFCSLDTELPLNKVKECLTLCAPDMVITEKEINGFYNMPFQDLYSEALYSKTKDRELIYPPSNAIMYILFTSGSTGKPKGVAILRKAFEEVIEWAKSNLGITSKDIVGQYCNISFDMGLCDVFLALSIGAELIPITGISKLTPGRMIKKYEISCLYAIPTIMDIFEKHHDFEKGNLNTLRLIGFGGAPLYKKHMQYICTYNPFLTVYNTYGPTETTLFTSCVIFTANDFQYITEKSVCLGNPITGVNYEIKDHDGITGELAVTGSHCLAGYLNEGEKIDFFEAESKEYFETGDLVYKKDDNYYFVTRKDNQIKIRGNRIDLDGIDSHINTFGESSISMIIDDRLVIFFTGSVSSTEIRSMLISYLPQNCMPDEFISIEEMPLNINGKYDKVALFKYYRKIKKK